IGTASRTVDAVDATVGVLVLTNFGSRPWLTVAGVPVGRLLAERRPPGGAPASEEEEAGSCIGIVATDAPCSPRQLEPLPRRARRVGVGLARCGSVAHHGSGEIFTAFSTRPAADLVPMRDDQLNPLFAAVVEAAEEAVLNSLFMATTVLGAHNHTVEALPVDE